MNIAIVVVAYNRPDSLKRLLNSIGRASYEGFDSIPLIISIDGGGDPEVPLVAQRFQWQFGEKKIYPHKTNLGLKQHVLSAGDRTSDYKGIIMLEDDLMVSPMFYRYGSRALQAYQDNETIGGISLYSYRYLDINGLVFLPSVGNGNTFLIKFPSSWGQAWAARQWQRFRSWLGGQRDNDCMAPDSKLPKAVVSWPASSWKKIFAQYLVDTNQYIVYPDVSLTTNMGDAGYHWSHNTLVFQVPLQFAPTTYRLTDPSHAISYDQFFELEARSLEVLGYSGDIPAGVEFDLYGQKPPALLRDKLIISSKRPKMELRSYGMELLPHELNILYGIQGCVFYLGEGSEFDFDSPIPRIDLIKHQTALLGGRELVNLLSKKLLGTIGVKA